MTIAWYTSCDNAAQYTVNNTQKVTLHNTDSAWPSVWRHHLVWWLNTKPHIIQSDIYMADYIPSTHSTTILSMFQTLPIIFGFCEHKLVKTGSSDLDQLFLRTCYHHHARTNLYMANVYRATKCQKHSYMSPHLHSCETFESHTQLP